MAIYSGFSHKKIVIFHSYVKLPEGNNFIKTLIRMFQSTISCKNCRKDIKTEVILIKSQANHIFSDTLISIVTWLNP